MPNKYKLLHARRVPSGYIIEGRLEAKPSVPRGDVAARHVSACNNAFVTHQLAETHYSTASLFLQRLQHKVSLTLNVVS